MWLGFWSEQTGKDTTFMLFRQKGRRGGNFSKKPNRIRKATGITSQNNTNS